MFEENGKDKSELILRLASAKKMAQIKTLTLFSVTTKCKPKNSMRKWKPRKKNLETGFYS